MLKTFGQKLSTFNGKGQKPYEIHASAGFVNRIPKPDESIERFIKESDVMMYEEKTKYKEKRGGRVR